MTAAEFACDHAWVDGAIADRVVIRVDGDRFGAVRTNDGRFDEVARAGTHLRGVVLPGLVNAHSHAFHRALRGRTHSGTGSFWTWREQMYAVAGLLDPDGYHALATAVFGEMLLAGITLVGEFHYLHHAAGGSRYADPNAMGQAIIAAAAQVGIRLTLLDAVYLTGAVGDSINEPGLSPVQRRFSDGTVDGWASRTADLQAPVSARKTTQIGAAIHSVRAVPAPQQAEVVAAVAPGTILHAHVAEQPAEGEATARLHGRTPVGLLSDAGALSSTFTAVHAVWLDDTDIGLLGRAQAGACICPTTERDLADGIVRADRLAAAGVSLSLGTDQHASIDLLEEARGVELDLRLATQARGNLSAATLLDAATSGGARSLGWPETGRIAAGALADLCVVGLGSVRLAGLRHSDLLPGILFAATAADISHTMVGGRMVVANGRHISLDVPGLLASSIDAVDPTAPQ